MEFDLTWILLGVPLAFALGWIASRIDLRQLRLEDNNAPKAYFRGLGHLLNEQQDAAIDAFIEAIQKDPETSELHFALGNLFRRRGEYERAVRVHEHLISRADLSASDRQRAQHALALDFLSAGLLDHAEQALLKLAGSAYENEAQQALLALYERAGDWARATAVAQQLQARGGADYSARMAHHLCEQAAQLQRDAGPSAQVGALLQQATERAPGAARPRVALAQWLAEQGKPVEALAQLNTLVSAAPVFAPLVASTMVQLAAASQRLAKTGAQLEQLHKAAPSVDLADALAQADRALGDAAARPGQQRYVQHMQTEPSVIAAQHWLAHADCGDGALHKALSDSLARAAQRQSRYRCAACGFETSHYFWQCPGCQSWDSFPPRRIEEL